MFYSFPIILVGILFFQYANAIPEGPSGPSTIEQYCFTGTCSTGNLYQNETINFNGSYSLVSNANLVGIRLSSVCIKLEEQHLKSDCLDYSQLKPLEKVNPLLSGNWINDTYYHKIYYTFKGVWNYYSGSPVVLIDPPIDFQVRAKIITVENQNFTWTDVNDNATNTGIIEYVNRFVDGSCSSATVAPIFSLVNDTVNYLQSDCTKTNYNSTKVLNRVDIPFDYNSMNIKQINYLHNFNNNTSMGNCITEKCNLPHDPYSNSGYWTIPISKVHLRIHIH